MRFLNRPGNLNELVLIAEALGVTIDVSYKTVETKSGSRFADMDERLVGYVAHIKYSITVETPKTSRVVTVKDKNSVPFEKAYTDREFYSGSELSGGRITFREKRAEIRAKEHASKVVETVRESYPNTQFDSRSMDVLMKRERKAVDDWKPHYFYV